MGAESKLRPHGFLTTQDGNKARLYIYVKVEGLGEVAKVLLRDSRGAAGWEDRVAKIKMRLPGVDGWLEVRERCCSRPTRR